MKKPVVETLLIAAVIVALDQLTKWYMLEVVDIANRAPIDLTSFLRLVMVWNQGISFGMLSQSTYWLPYLLMGMAIVISTVLARLALKTADGWERFGYALVIGGALGNVIDRARFGAVADFVYFHVGDLGWPAFNLADSAICIGVGLLLIRMLKQPKQA